MQTNVGDTDRMVRLVLGAVLTAVSAAGFLDYMSMSPVVAGVVGAAGLVLLVTGYTRKCPVLQMAGVSTAGSSTSSGEEQVEEPESAGDWEEEPEPRE
ncbi:MAG: DUF2892 domain-containing protein [Candidatus Nanohaloarchaea archaeon]